MSDQPKKLTYRGSSRSSVDYLLLARECCSTAQLEADATRARTRHAAAKFLNTQRKKLRRRAVELQRRLEQRAMLARALEQERLHRESAEAQAEETMTLAFELARKVVGDTIEKSSLALLQQLQLMISRYRHQHSIVIHLSSADYSRLILQRALLPDTVDLKKSDMPPGTARIETKHGALLLSVLDTFDELSRAVKRTLAKERAE